MLKRDRINKWISRHSDNLFWRITKRIDISRHDDLFSLMLDPQDCSAPPQVSDMGALSMGGCQWKARPLTIHVVGNVFGECHDPCMLKTSCRFRTSSSIVFTTNNSFVPIQCLYTFPVAVLLLPLFLYSLRCCRTCSYPECEIFASRH